MKRIKPIVLILATFVIGFGVGFLTSSHLRMRKVKAATSLMSLEAFKGRSYNILQPTPEQMDKLDPIMREFANKNREMIGNFKKQADKLMEDQWRQIKPILNTEQLERLEDMENWRRAYWRGRPEGGGRGREFSPNGGRPMRDMRDPIRGGRGWQDRNSTQ